MRRARAPTCRREQEVPDKSRVNVLTPSPSEYEQLVAEIAAGICAGAPKLKGLVPGFGSKNRLVGASGYKHQIDVSLQAGKKIFLIECKRWEKKIGVPEVLILAARVGDIHDAQPGASIQGILASKVGASKNAKTLADYWGIQLEVIRSANEFGLRIGKYAHAAMSDGITFGDQVTATFIEAPNSSSDTP